MDTSNFSTLNKTWIFDLDGTLVTHNGYKAGQDTLLSGVKEFFETHINDSDYVLILTARDSKFKGIAEKCFLDNSIIFDRIIYDLPVGERILFNDKKDSGLITAYSINLERNKGL
jgi:FMN phosphatase YigB (HAD superfamily)